MIPVAVQVATPLDPPFTLLDVHVPDLPDQQTTMRLRYIIGLVLLLLLPLYWVRNRSGSVPTGHGLARTPEPPAIGSFYADPWLDRLQDPVFGMIVTVLVPPPEAPFRERYVEQVRQRRR